MGQAFDREGNVLGEAFGQTKHEVLDKLAFAHPDAYEVRIKTLDAPQAEMPRYRCHKEVHALKVVSVQMNGEGDGSATLLVEAPYAGIQVTHDWLARHEPTVGGYYVVYKDGYVSFSPPEAFEDGYTRI